MLVRCGRRPDATEELARIMDGSWLTEHYLELARDLDVMEPKAPEDVYKVHQTYTAALCFTFPGHRSCRQPQQFLHPPT